MHTKLTMKYPASWHNDMWREGAPFGSGKVGGLVYGGAFKEIIALNHAFLWRGGRDQEMPDVSDKLPEIRRLLDAHKIREADSLLSDTLRKRGYQADFVQPQPVCDLLIETPPHGIFEQYRREIDMEKAEVTVSWKDAGIRFCRRVFASRCNHLVFTEYSCEGGTLDADLSLTLHDTETMQNVVIPRQDSIAKGDCLYFAAYNESVYKPGDFGAVARVICDGSQRAENTVIKVRGARRILVVTRVFLETPRAQAFADCAAELRQPFSYDAELEAHRRLHAEIFDRVDFSVSPPAEQTCNEELLLEAFDGRASAEMIEKLYAYGRYLFICSTSDHDSLPCHLTGLFNGTYQCFWAFNMFNVNFQMIYWQTLAGNMPSFLRLALDYVEAMMPDFRENAKKIFGCRGILINSVNTPESGLYKCLANHIVNWTGGAAWVSQHFWDYYSYTGDTAYLKEHVLPFLYETALFYEDFAVENADGLYDLYPSVSPENSAYNVVQDAGLSGVETAKNATMEFALMKELLTHLIEGCTLTGLYADKLPKWREMLSKIRPYGVNEDGAVREWNDPYYLDNYHHRHHSHLYPVFPGSEVTAGDERYPAFVKAEEMRLKYGLSDQCNWSIVYMACIAARMKKGDFSLELLETLAKNLCDR